MLSLSKENVFLTEVFMQKKVSVKDIAEELNISLSTVHKALTGKGGISEARRKEVLDMAKRMGYVVNPIAQSLARKNIRIGIVIPSKWQEYFSQMKAGIEKEIQSLQKYKVEGCFYFLNSHFSNQEEKNLINWLKTDNIDALIYCPSIYSFEEELFHSIKKIGIPVFFAGDTFDNAESISKITTDSEISGKLAADFLNCIYPKGPRAAVLTGSLKVKPHKIKTDAFNERIKKQGGRVICVCETDDDEAKTYEYIDEICSQDIDALYVSTATSLPVCRYFESKGIKDEITLICTDVFDELKYYMKKGIVKATIYQNQEEIGKKAVRAAYDYFVNKNSYGGELMETEPLITVKPRLYLLADIE